MNEIIEEVKQAVKYDSNSPSKLSWNVVRLCGKGDKLTEVGSPAGFKSNRYYCVEINGTSYLAHRIIYELVNGKIPDGYIIDHVNRNTFDNSPKNLGAKRQLYNTRNQRKRSNNTSGVTGVKLEKERFGLRYWVAIWNDPILLSNAIRGSV